MKPFDLKTKSVTLLIPDDSSSKLGIAPSLVENELSASHVHVVSISHSVAETTGWSL